MIPFSDYVDFFSDNVLEFDTRCDEVLLSMTKFPPDDNLESLYKLSIRGFVQLKTVLELYDMEIHQKKAKLNCQKLKTMSKRSVEQHLRLRNFEARNGKIESEAADHESKGTTSRSKRTRRMLAMVEPTGSVRKETLAVSGTIRISRAKSNATVSSFSRTFHATGW